jgi:hypothetical protein
MNNNKNEEKVVITEACNLKLKHISKTKLVGKINNNIYNNCLIDGKCELINK